MNCELCRHRQLISINKANTGSGDPVFNERHDWNSLLSDDPELKFSRYSAEYWPSANDLVRYLEDFAASRQLNIRYRTTVDAIRRRPEGGFSLETTTATATTTTTADSSQTTDDTLCEQEDSGGGGEYQCTVVVMATGVTPQVPDITGIELAEGCIDTSGTHARI